MRIGLLSPHYAYNYGAKLQAFALKTYLRKQGHDAVIINRRPAYQCAIPSFLGRMARRLEEFAKRNSFGKFEDTFLQPQTEPIITEGDWSKFPSFKLDAVIVGSDQVWRDDYAFSSFGYNLFLDFVDEATKRISYAPSLGKESWNAPEEVSEKVRQLLHKFDAISVRESSSISILKDKFDVDSQLVVDPTMLLSSDEYREIFNIPIKSDNYIAAYILDDNETFKKRLRQLAQEAQKPIHKISVGSPKSSLGIMLNRFQRMTPVTKWIENIANASSVITNSFHGMVFSIIFRKQFVVVMNKERGAARFKSLLEMLGLENRLTDETDSQYNRILSTPIDYKSIKPRIEHWRNISFAFLHDNLQQ